MTGQCTQQLLLVRISFLVSIHDGARRPDLDLLVHPSRRESFSIRADLGCEDGEGTLFRAVVFVLHEGRLDDGYHGFNLRGHVKVDVERRSSRLSSPD